MARRFRFRLETVRRLRERERDARRRVVGEAVRAVGRIEDRIARLTRELQGTIDQSRGVCEEVRLDMVSLRGHQYYRGWLHRQILESNARLALRRAELDAECARLGETSKRLKVIENLHNKQSARHCIEVAREEQADADEVALQRHLRQSRNRREVRA